MNDAKMPVHSSHLALRFYKSDGWTKEILDQYVVRGRVVDVWQDQPVRDYYFLDHTQSSQLDMDKLYNERVSKVYRWSDTADQLLGDLEYLKEMNE